MAHLRLILLTTLALALALPAAAQTSGAERRSGRQAAPAPPPPPVEPAPPPPSTPQPYEPQLLRLAEILGALHHLRTVCNASDANVWRDRMSALIESEGQAPDRRDRLAGAFNASFRAWGRSYRTCTPAADVAVRRFMADASKIATDVNARYGQ